LLGFVVTGKTPGLISRSNFVKKFLSSSAIAVTSCQDVLRTALCSSVRGCGTKRAHDFLLSKSFSKSGKLQCSGCSKMLLSFLVLFDGHFFIKSATESMFNSVRVDFGQPPISSFSTSSPPSRNREYQLKNLIGSELHSHKHFKLIVF